MADAREFCQTHGPPPEDIDLVEWLVGEHLTMSAVAQRDIYDPETVQAFAERVGDVRRLTALYLLSVADIRGTSPKVWNAWKGKLLEDLYTSTLRMLARGGQVGHRIRAGRTPQRSARNLLRLSLVPDGVEEKLWKQLDTVYFLRHEARKSPGTRACSTALSIPMPHRPGRGFPPAKKASRCWSTPRPARPVCPHLRLFGRTHYSIADA